MSELSERELALMEMAFDEGGSEGYGESRGLFAQGFDAWIADNAARLDKVAPAALTWSDEPPTEPGWYWIEGEADPIYVMPLPGRDGLVVLRVNENSENVFCSVADVQMRWSGPICPPPLPEIGG